MATLTVEVDDKELSFLKSLLNHFSFVTIRETSEDTDEEVLSNLRQGIEELGMIQKGELKSRSAREFLKDL
ncbi:hypothetical protein [Dyadobacter luticola]|uniref:Uncharacterized protein n=1 Tax=Dyadobacter luticola TaxID=1979387 RepID=A0A5R9KSH6_9BACT|nr:hypothetical protein [Dyadobacter luticola]TLU99117.1 hypothetical protein FEN17_21300 [Dyadobacter luticola]